MIFGASWYKDGGFLLNMFGRHLESQTKVADLCFGNYHLSSFSFLFSKIVVKHDNSYIIRILF